MSSFVTATWFYYCCTVERYEVQLFGLATIHTSLRRVHKLVGVDPSLRPWILWIVKIKKVFRWWNQDICTSHPEGNNDVCLDAIRIDDSDEVFTISKRKLLWVARTQPFVPISMHFTTIDCIWWWSNQSDVRSASIMKIRSRSHHHNQINKLEYNIMLTLCHKFFQCLMYWVLCRRTLIHLVSAQFIPFHFSLLLVLFEGAFI